MSDHLTLRGFVATDVELKHLNNFKVASFRMGSPESRFNRETQQWEEVGINWYTVSAFRELGSNVKCSLKKGERIIVTGRLKVRSFVRNDNTTGTAIEVEAESVGHDLLFGSASFLRASQARQQNDPQGQGRSTPDGSHTPEHASVFDTAPPGVDTQTGELSPAPAETPAAEMAHSTQGAENETQDGEDRGVPETREGQITSAGPSPLLDGDEGGEESMALVS